MSYDYRKPQVASSILVTSSRKRLVLLAGLFFILARKKVEWKSTQPFIFSAYRVRYSEYEEGREPYGYRVLQGTLRIFS